MGALFTNPEALREHISEALHQKSLEGGGFPEDVFLSPRDVLGAVSSRGAL